MPLKWLAIYLEIFLGGGGGLLLLTWTNFIPSIISKQMPSKVWGEITYPFPNFNGKSIEVWEWIINLLNTVSQLI